MANVDNPTGFRAIGHLSGGEIRTEEMIVTTGQTIYRGDLIKGVAGGTVEEADADDGVVVVGVAAQYVDDSASAGGKKILVYVDPQIIYAVQADSGSTPAATDRFATANHVAGSGSSTTKNSGHELDSSDMGTGLQLRILDKINEASNAWGEHVDLRVMLSESAFTPATTTATI